MWMEWSLGKDRVVPLSRLRVKSSLHMQAPFSTIHPSPIPSIRSSQARLYSGPPSHLHPTQTPISAIHHSSEQTHKLQPAQPQHILLIVLIVATHFAHRIRAGDT